MFKNKQTQGTHPLKNRSWRKLRFSAFAFKFRIQINIVYANPWNSARQAQRCVTPYLPRAHTAPAAISILFRKSRLFAPGTHSTRACHDRSRTGKPVRGYPSRHQPHSHTPCPCNPACSCVSRAGISDSGLLACCFCLHGCAPRRPLAAGIEKSFMIVHGVRCYIILFNKNNVKSVTFSVKICHGRGFFGHHTYTDRFWETVREPAPQDGNGGSPKKHAHTFRKPEGHQKGAIKNTRKLLDNILIYRKNGFMQADDLQ